MSDGGDRTCFVVQGFGKKTDYTDGRVLDLDASYAIIKEAVEAAGLKCIRADEIPHTGMIDLPMYEMLLQADLVIADLSTYNVNAAFELGVRYGLRPGATIIVAESLFKYPFDVGHIVIQTYKHLGEDVGAQEARRFRAALADAIRHAMDTPATDSPVYTFLQDLEPPQRRRSAARSAPSPSSSATVTARGGQPVRLSAGNAAVIPDGAFAFPTTPLAQRAQPSYAEALHRRVARGAIAGPLTARATPADIRQPATSKELLDQALMAINPPDGDAGNFSRAVDLLNQALEQRPNDAFIVQQLALATYKTELPDPEAALVEARHILEVLNPTATNDPETLILWGAIHRLLWESSARPADLQQAIASYERGFHLKQDYFFGINLAFLLDVRARESLAAGEKDEAIADSVQARRIRREVIRLATPLAEESDDDPTDKRYWLLAALWGAALGLGDAAAMAHWESQMNTLAVPQWMNDTRLEQGSKLRQLLASTAALRAG